MVPHSEISPRTKFELRPTLGANFPPPRTRGGFLVEWGNMNNQNPVKTSFWEFRSVKIYTSLGEKLLDFFVGLMIPGLAADIFLSRLAAFMYEQAKQEYLQFSIKDFLSASLPLFIVDVILIFGLFYFWKRRRHLAYGFLISLIFVILQTFLLGLF